MTRPITLAVDVMGGDESPHLFVGATLSFLQLNPAVNIILFGDEDILRAAVPAKYSSLLSERMTICHASQVVLPEEKPSNALRQKRESSMWMAAEAVAGKKADALLSAGNTGALMAIALHVIGRVEGVDRPAICKRMPVHGTSCYVLDLGANLTASVEQLHQFALMGAALAEVEGVQPVKVGLLNVGSEHQKGPEVLHEADTILQQDSRFSYAGFVEGNALFETKANVIVCDGFTGNIALKACEGLARYLLADLRRYLSASWWRRCLGKVMSTFAADWFRGLNPAKYNGALLLGLQGVVVKSHGGADEAGFAAALRVAYEQAQRKPHIRLAGWLR